MVAMGCHGIAIMADDKCGVEEFWRARVPARRRKVVQPVGRGTALGLKLAGLRENDGSRARDPSRSAHNRYQSEVQMKSCNFPEKGQSSDF